MAADGLTVREDICLTAERLMTRGNDKDAACDNGAAIVGFRCVTVMEGGTDTRR